MQKWQIDKQFDFCYGHRVHNQKLNTEFSLDGCLKCRHLHGHQGTIKVGLESDTLNEGMVTDFKHLNWLKEVMDKWFDHKIIFDKRDPLLAHEVPELFNYGIPFEECLTKPSEYNFWISDINVIDKISKMNNYPFFDDDEFNAIIEKYEGIVFVDFVPTSENLCKFIFDLVKVKMKDLDVKVSYVDYWETPKSHCRYSE